jgi:hypothetical protein
MSLFPMDDAVHGNANGCFLSRAFMCGAQVNIPKYGRIDVPQVWNEIV